MELEILGHNMEVTPRLHNYVEKKTSKLDRYMPNLSSVRVDLTSENTRSAVERQVAQITIRDDRGTILRAEERNSDIFAAIDSVVESFRLVTGGDEQTIAFAADDFIQHYIGSIHQGPLLTGHTRVATGGLAKSTVGLFDMPNGCFTRVAQGLFKIIAWLTGQSRLEVVGSDHGVIHPYALFLKLGETLADSFFQNAAYKWNSGEPFIKFDFPVSSNFHRQPRIDLIDGFPERLFGQQFFFFLL